MTLAESRATRCEGHTRPTLGAKPSLLLKIKYFKVDKRKYAQHFELHAAVSTPSSSMELPAPTITLGEALPFALVFEARRRAGAEKQAARTREKLKQTLVLCKQLRVRLASLCDAASEAAVEDAGEAGDEDGGSHARERARRSFMLHAACGAVRIDVQEGPQTNAGEFGDIEHSPPKQAQANPTDDAFDFVRQARAFRLAELAVAPPVAYTVSGTPPNNGTQGTSSTKRGGLTAASTRALLVLRGADDPPPAFAAGMLLLELAGCEIGSGDYEKIAGGQSISKRKPLVPYGVAPVDAAHVAKANVVTAARAFAATTETRFLKIVCGPGVGTGNRGSTHPGSNPFQFRGTGNADALTQDVLNSLLHTAAPWSGGGKTQNHETETDEITSAKLAAVALIEISDLESLAGDVLVVCATRIQNGVVRLCGKQKAEEGRGVVGKMTAGDDEAKTETKMELLPTKPFPEPKKERPTPDAQRTLDEFQEFQTLGFVFEVAEQAARRVRGPIERSRAEQSRARGGAGAGTENVLSVFEEKARAGRDAAAAAARAGDSGGDSGNGKAINSVAVRLLCARALRLHAMTCVALGQKPGEA